MFPGPHYLIQREFLEPLCGDAVMTPELQLRDTGPRQVMASFQVEKLQAPQAPAALTPLVALPPGALKPPVSPG
ncbi:hypothetical protein P7K49_024780 [Saguinus oedipus]|uniref:Uncharacterized protein n=1 Tax=Saguinus oedipus TaxID=9490 RepID=A0ABQ9UQG0_SAGOE|nr:hypothetical protein P7K49_024780 [Saguinus oedipus]